MTVIEGSVLNALTLVDSWQTCCPLILRPLRLLRLPVLSVPAVFINVDCICSWPICYSIMRSTDLSVIWIV